MTVHVDLSPAKRQLLQQRLNGTGASNRRPGDAIKRRLPGVTPPISAEQQDIWLHAAMAPAAPIYNEAFTIHRNGPLDLDALEQSFNEILHRIELWRTSFDLVDGQLCQIVHPELRLQLKALDLTSVPAADREAAALRIAEDEARKPFDLTQVPLLRATVVRFAPNTHRIYVAIHHLIFDGVSIYRVVLPQITALYEEFAAGRHPSPAEPALQYGDYALWRQRQLSTPEVERALTYWRRQLAGELPMLRLPTTRQPPAAPSYRGAMETFSLPAELSASLKALSQREGVTLYATMLAAFKALLHRYSDQDDIVIGGVTDTRRRPELAHVVGYFLNGLALRTRPSAELSFREYVTQVRGVVVDALDASAVPFNRVVREVLPKRNTARHPLFQVLFSIQPPAPVCADGWDLTQMDVTVGTAKFDLYLELEERHDGGIVGRFIYSTDLFDTPAIRRMIGHWVTLLQAVVETPHCALGSLPILTPDESRELLVDWNATECPFPSTTLHAWFEAQARRTPNAIAVEFQGRTWSYGDLDRHAARLARRLRRAGAGAGTLVAVAVERSLDMVAALLAVLKAGAAYLPLDGHLPAARLSLLIEDAGPVVLLTQQLLADRMPPSKAQVVLCDDGSTIDESDAALDVAVGHEDLAYVIYTSGSTGKPKGVEVCHRSVVNLLATMQRELSAGPADRLLAVTTISFDIAALELFLPLVSGGRVIVASREEATNPFELAGLARRSRCTIMQATPATWRGLRMAGWSGDAALKILCGGEALTADLAARLRTCGAALWNMYGPTETTIWSLMHKVGPADDPVPIGRPLANTKLYVLDQNGNPVPVGAAGELWIGGAGLARGYRNDPVQTGRRFLSVGKLAGERLYRTGDLVRYRADGVIEFLGRTDNQVKIRGFRVGLEEVDCALATHPDVAAGAVRASPDASGEMSLTAFVVSRTAPGCDIPGLQQFLQRSLPAYMVPSRVVSVTALPMTANGKVDRKGLPDAAPRTAPEIAEPTDDLERNLVRIWKNLLGTQTIEIHDSFFDLGGHSLLAFMLVAEIKRLTGRDLPLATLFKTPTIASLAELLRSSEEPAFSYLVQLREGAGRPLFLVHGVFGNVLQMKGLASRLSTLRPIYALQARGVDPRQEPHCTIAEMADAYIDAIRAQQPTGPYAIGGYSFGGLVAYEMACRLKELGEDIDVLALIDVDIHERNLPLLARIVHEWSVARRVWHKLQRLPAPQWPGYLGSKVLQVARRFLLRLALREHADPSNEVTGALSARAVRMYQIGFREFISFRPRRYDGQVNLFRVTGPRFESCDPLPILRHTASSVDVYDIAGSHETVMEERYVGSLALQLNRYLAGSYPDKSAMPASRLDDLGIGGLVQLSADAYPAHPQ